MSDNLPGVTTSFKSVLQFVKILIKKRNSESINNLSELFVKLIPKSISKFPKVNKLENKKICTKIMIFCLSN